QPHPHRGIFWIHLQDLLEDADGIIQFARLQKLFGDLQVLGAGIIEEPLLAVKFGQLQHALQRRLELADLFVHGDRLDREALVGIGIAYSLEAFGGFVGFAEAGVEVPHGIGDREIFRIGLDNFFVLSDGVLHLALLDILLRSAEYFLFVEPETESHKDPELQPLVLPKNFLRKLPRKTCPRYVPRKIADSSWELLVPGKRHLAKLL